MKRLLHYIKEKKLGLFPKTFILLICIILVPMVAVSLINYDISMRTLENEVNRSFLRTLKQTRNAVDLMLESTERITMQIIRSQAAQKFWNQTINISKYEDAQIVKETINTAEILMEGTAYIENIGIYSCLNNTTLFYTHGNVRTDVHTPSYRVLGEKEAENILEAFGSSAQSVWYEPGKDDIVLNRNDSLRLVKYICRPDKRPEGIVVVSIRNEEFSKLIQDLNLQNSGYFAIINAEGTPVITVNRNIHELDELKLNEILSDEEEGVTIAKIGKKDMMVSMTTSKYNQWRYVNIFPTDELNSNSRTIKNNILLVSLLFLGISVLLAFSMTKGICNPISLLVSILNGESSADKRMEKLKTRKDELGEINEKIDRIIRQLSSERSIKASIHKENIELKKQIDDNTSKMKDYFFYRLIFGDLTDIEEIRNQVALLETPMDANYFVFIADFDKNYEEITKEWDIERQNAVRNGLLDIFEKALLNMVNYTKIFYETDEGTKRIVGVVCADKEGNNIDNDSIKQMCNFIQNVIYSSLNFTVTISVGKTHFGLHKVRKSYNEALQALKHKFIFGSNAVILTDEIENENEATQFKKHYYKNHLVNCLNAGNMKGISELFEKLKEDIKTSISPKNDYIYYCKDIINHLLEYLGNINYLNLNDIEELNKAFLHFDEQFENLDKALVWLSDFIERVFASLKESGKSVSNTIENAINVIRSEYMNDISMFYVAEKVNLSPSYFSRLFKEETGRNFKDYLTDYRMRKAKELLLDTSLSIAKIAASVGYNNTSQFTKMFKNIEGITAAEYRRISGVMT